MSLCLLLLVMVLVLTLMFVDSRMCSAQTKSNNLEIQETLSCRLSLAVTIIGQCGSGVDRDLYPSE